MTADSASVVAGRVSEVPCRVEQADADASKQADASGISARQRLGGAKPDFINSLCILQLRACKIWPQLAE